MTATPRFAHEIHDSPRLASAQASNAAGVVDVQVLDQAAVDHINASRVLGYRHSDDWLLEPPRRHTHRR